MRDALPPEADGGDLPEPFARRDLVRHLPFFLMAARMENFSEAAAALDITKSALSRRMHRLEHELGATLFDRRQRGVALTPAGRELRRRANDIMRKVGRAIDRIGAVERGEEGSLSIGIIPRATSCDRIADGLSLFRRRHPGVMVRMHAMLTGEQLKALPLAQIDVGFLYDFNRDDALDRRFAARDIQHDALMLALPRGHRLENQPVITLEDLAQEPLIWPSRRQSGLIQSSMSAAFAKKGIEPQIVLEVVTAEMTVNSVLARLGIGFVHQSQPVPDAVLLRNVEGLDIPLRLRMAWARAHKPRLIANLLDCLDLAPAGALPA